MISPDPIGWVNTGLPLALLAALAILLPILFVPRATRSQGRLALGIGLTALAVLALGTLTFAGLYALYGHAVEMAFHTDPMGVSLFFLERSGMAAAFWGPVLALVWLGRAQGVEKRKGEDIMRGGRGGGP